MSLIIEQIFSSAGQAIQKGLGLQQQSANALFEKALFAGAPPLPEFSQILSGQSIGSAWVISDCNSLYRSVQDLAVEVCSYLSEAPNFIREFASTKDITLVYHVFGLASAFNFIIGLVKLKGAFDAVAYAEAIGDGRGVLTGRLSYIKAGSAVCVGLSYGIFRPLAMIEVIKKTLPANLIGRLAYLSSQAGTFFFTVYFAALAAIFSVGIDEWMTFIKGLNRAEGLMAKVEYLQKTLRVEPSEIYRELVEKHGRERADDFLIDEALASGSAYISSMMEKMSIPKVEEAKLKEIVRSVVKGGCSGWTQGVIQKQVDEKLRLFGLSIRMSKAHLKQSAKMKRLLGREGFAALEALESLKGRIAKTDAKAQELVDKVSSSAKANLRENVFNFSVSFFGVVAMMMGVVFTGGVPLIISLAVMLVFNILIGIIDGCDLYRSCRDERPAPQDKKMVILSMIVGVASLLSLIALAASGVVTMGIFPIIVTAVLSTLWIGQSGVSWLIIDRSKKRYEVEHPTLETFLKALESGCYKEKIMEMFGNLAEELKGQIQCALNLNGNDMRKAAFAVAKRVEEVRAKRLAMLRMALTSHLVRESAS